MLEVRIRMSFLFFFTDGLLLAAFLLTLLKVGSTLPEGYEDEGGFHYGADSDRRVILAVDYRMKNDRR